MTRTASAKAKAKAKDSMTLPATEPAPIPVYGMQHEVCLRARPDQEGQPQSAPLFPIISAYRVSGDLSLPSLMEAMQLVADRTDVLHARMLRVDDAYFCVPAPTAAMVPIVVTDARRSTLDAVRPALGQLVRQATLTVADMRLGPRGTFLIVRLSDDDHLVAGLFDHGMLDQQSAIGLMRRLGQVYGALASGRSADAEALAAVPSFFAHARQAAADVAGREAAATYLRSATAVPYPRLTFPGGRWMPWQERAATTSLAVDVSGSDLAVWRRAVERSHSSFMNVFLAATSIVASACADGAFVPLTYQRHGRSPQEMDMVGPMWETLLTRGDGRPQGPVADWVSAFHETNIATPALRGLSLTSFATLGEVLELRRIAVNIRMPSRPMTFGRLRAVPTNPMAVFGSDGGGVTPPAHNAGIRLLMQPDGSYKITFLYDTADLHDAKGLLDSVFHVVRTVVERPGTTCDQMLDEVSKHG